MESEGTLKLRCPSCGSKRLGKAGFKWCGKHNKRQRWYCNDCHGTTIAPRLDDNEIYREVAGL